ncbi:MULTISPECIES: TRAP transporter small permease subunit [unclassified Halomonas]|uniref:TRAP transporter small permease subunit n=1 Tax=unclassified Halomonas TaxID=2609666 RepID=UPI0028874A40|nr:MULTISPECIES: TRAP transporter small permease subunit [unclassified Halomonas]MDT0500732.1 TRAP transporter small permease subunit [Halomonas sp. PAR7]MDT0513078.1 TRAP transporter small permease subunit [Halomonas sp. LES1]MDT0591511.1 TRAP transporter small permease subunit [Halomonas sp. PAR8]
MTHPPNESRHGGHGVSDEQRPERGPERTALDRLVARGARGAAWLVLVAMAISVVEVFLRYGFNNPTSWVHESVVFLVAVSFALAGPAALARNAHIRVRVLYDSAGPRLKCWMDRFNDFVTLGFCLAMSYAAFHMFWRASHNPFGEWQLERSGTSWNPPFPALVKGVILFALALMTLQALLHLVQSLRARPADPASVDNEETR